VLDEIGERLGFRANACASWKRPRQGTPLRFKKREHNRSFNGRRRRVRHPAVISRQINRRVQLKFSLFRSVSVVSESPNTLCATWINAPFPLRVRQLRKIGTQHELKSSL